MRQYVPVRSNSELKQLFGGITGKFRRALVKLGLYRSLGRSLVQKRFEYRVATQQDALALQRFYDSVGTSNKVQSVEHISAQIKDLKEWGCQIIAEKKGKIVGSATITRFADEMTAYPDWWIFGVIVHPKYRGKGIGEKLVQMALQKAEEYNASRVNLTVFENNRAAIELYRKLGFHQASIKELEAILEEDVRQGKARRIIMSRDISSTKG